MDRWSSGHQAVDPACSHVRMEGSPRIGTVIDSGHMDPPATPTEQYFVVTIRFAPRYRLGLDIRGAGAEGHCELVELVELELALVELELG